MGDSNIFNLVIFKGIMFSIGYNIEFQVFHIVIGFVALEWNVTQKKTRYNKVLGFANEWNS